jgi:MYXO-CTERM domain-containing protein
MIKLLALIATMLLSFSLAFAQTADQPRNDGTTTANQQTDNGPHHDYGWIGLLGLAGLAGFAGRRRDARQDRERGATEIRRAA